MTKKLCECNCGCDEIATTTDEGVRLCDACADYYLDEDGQPVCSRDQDETTCRHCGTPIDWSIILTGQAMGNWREGRCDCRVWKQTEQGPGNWRMEECEAPGEP